MANNYVHLCFGIETKSDAEKRWWLRVEAEVSSFIGEEEEIDNSDEFFNEEEMAALQGLEGYGLSIEEATRVELSDIYVVSEGEGDVSAAATIAQLYLKRFAPTNYIYFEWAETSSPSRVNEFGGGACVVTANTILMKSTTEMRNELERQIVDGDMSYSNL